MTPELIQWPFQVDVLAGCLAVTVEHHQNGLNIWCMIIQAQTYMSCAYMPANMPAYMQADVGIDEQCQVRWTHTPVKTCSAS